MDPAVRWVLCAGSVEIVRLREGAEMRYTRRHGSDMPIPLISSGTGARIRISVLGGLARTLVGGGGTEGLEAVTAET